MLQMLLAAQLMQGPGLPFERDTALFPAREALIRLYTDCDEARLPGLIDTLVPKTPQEVAQGVEWRQSLEGRWREWFWARAGDSIAATAAGEWRYPLAVRGRLLNNFLNPREGGPHGALDIFVAREGVDVRAPVSGVVIAAGDAWVGGWRRRGGLWYEGGGMSRRQGNGLLLYDPASGGYFLISHLQPGVTVRTGDVVRAGQVVGRVGHTGNASVPSRGRHLHIAYKLPGSACGTSGVLVGQNPYQQFRAARERRGGEVP